MDGLVGELGGRPGEPYDSTTGRTIFPEVVYTNTGEPNLLATARIRART